MHLRSTLPPRAPTVTHCQLSARNSVENDPLVRSFPAQLAVPVTSPAGCLTSSMHSPQGLRAQQNHLIGETSTNVLEHSSPCKDVPYKEYWLFFSLKRGRTQGSNCNFSSFPENQHVPMEETKTEMEGKKRKPVLPSISTARQGTDSQLRYHNSVLPAQQLTTHILLVQRKEGSK